MDSLISAAARALPAGDALQALKHVALRADPPALALRGIAMAQLGEHARARELLRRAARGLGPQDALARARCIVAEAEVALAMRDFSASPRALVGARATLEARGDRANALQARLIAARQCLLLGPLEEAGCEPCGRARRHRGHRTRSCSRLATIAGWPCWHRRSTATWANSWPCWPMAPRGPPRPWRWRWAPANAPCSARWPNWSSRVACARWARRGRGVGAGCVAGVSFDGERGWAATGTALMAFDPASGETERRFERAADAGTAFDGTHLYQIAEARIDKIDPATGKVVASIPAPGKGHDSGARLHTAIGLPRCYGESASTTTFRGLLSVHSRCGPHDLLAPNRGLFKKCFSPFVTSWTAPRASGRSESLPGRTFTDGSTVPWQGKDNNLIERQIKPWKLGAKNWLFIGSELAGQRAAVVMSLVQSAKLNALDPWAYLRDVLARIHSHPSHRIGGLPLPASLGALGDGAARRPASWSCTPTPSRWRRRTLTVVEPRDPFERCELDRLACLPGSAPVDDLGLVQPVDGVQVAAPYRAARRCVDLSGAEARFSVTGRRPSRGLGLRNRGLGIRAVPRKSLDKLTETWA
jgi:hypothetical protein